MGESVDLGEDILVFVKDIGLEMLYIIQKD